MAELQKVLSVRDFTAWRSAARSLLAAGIAPDEIVWNDQAADTLSLFCDGTSMPVMRTAQTNALFSASLLEMIRLASCHDAPDRWALFYRILWRWTRGDRSCAFAADVDGCRLHQLSRAVRNEVCHLMSFVRFRERRVCEGEAPDPRYVAWLEPTFPVLREVAPHFARRMGNVSWIIASPDESVLCDGSRLMFSAGQARFGVADDPNEALWATYYRSTFNPGRLNVGLMRGHMPERFWKNLPEASEIEALVGAAELGAPGPAPTAGSEKS